jgi:hypothetical protein
MMMVVVVMVVYYHHNLGLRRIRECEAKDESESKQNLFHSSQYGALQMYLQSCSDRCVARHWGWCFPTLESKNDSRMCPRRLIR